MTTEIQEQRSSVVRGLEQRAEEAEEKGNIYAAAYLACIAGMWANAFSQNCKSDLAKRKSQLLMRWFYIGYDSFSQAIQTTSEMREKKLEKKKK